MDVLDRSKPYDTLHGFDPARAGAKFWQDGRYFGPDGSRIRFEDSAPVQDESPVEPEAVIKEAPRRRPHWKQVVEAIPGQDTETLRALLAEEQANRRPRSSVINALTNELSRRDDPGPVENETSQSAG